MDTPQNQAPPLQDILEKALQHFSHCRLDRAAMAEEGFKDNAPMIAEPLAYLDPEASFEDAWVSAISAAMGRHQEETDAMENAHRKAYKDLKEIEDISERNKERSQLAKKHAGEKLELKSRHDLALNELTQGYPKHPDLEGWIQEQERKMAEENQGVVEGDIHVKPIPLDIRGFKPEPVEKGVRFSRTSGKGSFVDFGKKIAIDRWKDPVTTLAALQPASEKWPTLTVFGPPKYLKLCAELAAEHGFKITNPEVQEMAEAIKKIRGVQQVGRSAGPKM